MSDCDDFEGGPLADGREGQIHALHVYMQGDGQHSAGYYVQTYLGNGAGLGVFKWVPGDGPVDDE